MSYQRQQFSKDDQRYLEAFLLATGRTSRASCCLVPKIPAGALRVSENWRMPTVSVVPDDLFHEIGTRYSKFEKMGGMGAEEQPEMT